MTPLQIPHQHVSELGLHNYSLIVFLQCDGEMSIKSELLNNSPLREICSSATDNCSKLELVFLGGVFSPWHIKLCLMSHGVHGELCNTTAGEASPEGGDIFLAVLLCEQLNVHHTLSLSLSPLCSLSLCLSLYISMSLGYCKGHREGQQLHPRW